MSAVLKSSACIQLPGIPACDHSSNIPGFSGRVGGHRVPVYMPGGGVSGRQHKCHREGTMLAQNMVK